MSAFTTYSHLQQENEGRWEWGGRHDQHVCHSLVKVLHCWWAPSAASLLTLARRHQLSDYTHGCYRQTDAATDLDVSHTKCASLVTDAQRQWPDKKLRDTDIAIIIVIRSWRDVTIIDH